LTDRQSIYQVLRVAEVADIGVLQQPASVLKVD